MAEFTQESLALLIETAKETVDAGKSFGVVPITSTGQVALVDDFAESVTLVDIDPPKRSHRLASVLDVVAWAKLHAAESPMIWIGETSIIVTLDAVKNRTRGDYAAYSWKMTPEFELLQKLSKQTNDSTFEQNTLIKLLRTTLWDNFVDTNDRDSLITSIRNVIAQQASGINQGKGTYEASMATANGTPEKWPDRLRMQARVYDDTSLVTLQKIDVVLDVNAQNKTWSLWPTVASIAAAITDVREHASEMIRGNIGDVGTINVFAGAPEVR